MTEQQPPTVCQHGSLQRACLVCEVTAERDTALQLVSEMRHAEDILHRTLDTVCAERDAAVAALTEAHRVLREVEWLEIDVDIYERCPMCDSDKPCHARHCPLAAVLAQDTHA